LDKNRQEKNQYDSRLVEGVERPIDPREQPVAPVRNVPWVIR
jgi:hypothetical protein